MRRSSTDRTDDVLAASDVVITASGTATVQAALHEKPMVVVYRLSPLTYRLGKPFVNVDMYAMVNLVAGSRVVPELIQDDFTPERVAEETVALLTNWSVTRARAKRCRSVCEQLGCSRRERPGGRCHSRDGGRTHARPEFCIKEADRPCKIQDSRHVGIGLRSSRLHFASCIVHVD